MARLRPDRPAHPPSSLGVHLLGRGAAPKGRWLGASVVILSLAAAACGSKSGGKGAPSSSASASGGPVASAAPSGSAASHAPHVDDTPKGPGVTATPAIDKAKCAPSSIELATYLQRGELTIAGRDGQIAASWLVQLKDKAQIGFAGFDGEAKRLARDRGIGNAREHAPTLFASGPTDWIVTWFDGEGLAYARPRWEAQPGPEVEHLTTVKDVPPEDVAIASTLDGALVVASPFGTQGDQLSLFVFASPDGSQKAQALGLTKSAKKPHKPAVAADADGYALAWIEGDGTTAVTRLDKSGKELHPYTAIVPKPASGETSDVTIVATDTGFELTWASGDDVYTRHLDKDAMAAGPPLIVGKGKSPVAVAAKGQVFVAYLGDADGKAQQLLVVRVGADAVSSSAVRMSDGQTEVKDPPSIAIVGDRLAVAWTEQMSPIVSTKRATLRTVNASCIP